MNTIMLTLKYHVSEALTSNLKCNNPISSTTKLQHIAALNVRMKLIKIFLYSVGIVVAAVPVTLIGMFFYFTSDMCGNYLHSESISPNGRYKAVIFQRDCGATTGFSTQISIVKTSEVLKNRPGNIFIVDGHPDRYAPNIFWSSDSELVIDRVINGNEHKAADSWGFFNKINIVYRSKHS